MLEELHNPEIFEAQEAGGYTLVNDIQTTSTYCRWENADPTRRSRCASGKALPSEIRDLRPRLSS